MTLSFVAAIGAHLPVFCDIFIWIEKSLRINSKLKAQVGSKPTIYTISKQRTFALSLFTSLTDGFFRRHDESNMLNSSIWEFWRAGACGRTRQKLLLGGGILTLPTKSRRNVTSTTPLLNSRACVDWQPTQVLLSSGEARRELHKLPWNGRSDLFRLG